MRLFEAKKQRAELLTEINGIRSKAENGTIPAHLQGNYSTAMALVGSLDAEIASLEKDNSLRAGPRGFFDAARPAADEAVQRPWGQPEAGRPSARGSANPHTRTQDYAFAVYTWLKSKGTVVADDLYAGTDGFGGFMLPGSDRFAPVGMSAALDEGTAGSGGYAVSVPTVPQIVPLGMPDLGVFNESTVIGTETDQKWPIQGAFGVNAAKAESGGSTNNFSETDPTIGQFTLSAWMAGGLRLLSWELIQDVKQFQDFAVRDLINAQLIFEGNWYVNGSGSGQAQGVLGNVGTGTGSAYELTGTASTDAQLLLDAVFDVVGTLKAVYQPNAVWIMSRATAMAIRRAQMQTNLFAPVLTTDADGTDRLLGHRVAYDANMPALPSATSAGVVPILYGDFKQGYLIGVRGGAGINVKVLDQPWALSGQTGIVAYRRVDGRVRRSEAIQEITISHS